VTKTQSAGPISSLEHRATRVLHCAIVTRAAVLMFPLLLQTDSIYTARGEKIIIAGCECLEWPCEECLLSMVVLSIFDINMLCLKSSAASSMTLQKICCI